MRTVAELDEIPVLEWTSEEGFAHLTATFDEAARAFPGLLERYVIMLADASEDGEKIDIMRRGLRETIKARYPQHQPAGAAE